MPRTRPTDAFSIGNLWIALVTFHCGPWDQTAHPQQPVTSLSEFPDPAKATIARGPSSHEWLVTDERRNRMLINIRTIAARPHWAGTVYSVNGPKDSLPDLYTLGCDPKVFQGTWESDPAD